MITQNEEKKMLIESMKKLTSHVSGNLMRQREIFDALSLQDFNKIVTNLKDQNEYLRRVSALLLCQLFYRNDQTKAGLVSLLGIQPKYGRICLGSIPETIYNHPSTLKKCLQLMQGQIEQNQDDKICWLINLERKTLKLELLEYKRYSSFTFVDPAKNIFGITILNLNKKKEEKADKSPSISFKTTLGSDSARKQATKEVKQRSQTNSVQNHRQFIKDKQKQLQSLGNGKKNLNLTLDLQSVQKTSLGSPSPQYKNQLSNSINQSKDLNTSYEIKPKNVDIRSKIDSIKDSKGIKSTYQFSPKISVRNSYQPNLQLQYNLNKTYQPQIVSQRFKSSRFGVDILNSARQNFSGDQQTFYKRTENLLKK